VFLRIGTGIKTGGVAILVAVAEERVLGCTATPEMIGALTFGTGGGAIKLGGPERFRAVGGGATGNGLPRLDWGFVSSLV